MKIYNSPFRGDDIPVNNIYKLLFDNPTTDVPRTHIVYINPLTGASRTRGEHIDRVRRLATALVASHSEGGLALTRDQRVGILCENDMVSEIHVPASPVASNLNCSIGLQCYSACLLLRWNSCCVAQRTLYQRRACPFS